jgi:hypothetical protein
MFFSHLFMKRAPFSLTQDDAPPGVIPDGYTPFYVTKGVAPSFVKRAEKRELIIAFALTTAACQA